MRVTYMENTVFIGCCSSFGQGEQRDCGRSSRKHALVCWDKQHALCICHCVFMCGGEGCVSECENCPHLRNSAIGCSVEYRLSTHAHRHLATVCRQLTIPSYRFKHFSLLIVPINYATTR